MPDSISESMNCPVCLEVMEPPIRQCEKGHSTCGTCVTSNNLQTCPLCRAPMTEARSYQLEELISKLKDVTLSTACAFASRGCKYVLKMEEKELHELECKNRTYKCEGKKYCGWNCDWSGKYEDIVQHFKNDHQRLLEFKAENSIKIDFSQTFADVQVIDYQNGQQIFWYKFKLDLKEGKVYWLLQYVGLRKQAAQYYYEFEVYEGITRKLKFTELCESDCKDAHAIFDEEKCVAISFKMAKHFVDSKGELYFRFRIMKIKPPNLGTAPNPALKSHPTAIGRTAGYVPPPRNPPSPASKSHSSATGRVAGGVPPSRSPQARGGYHNPMPNPFCVPYNGGRYDHLVGPALMQRSGSVPHVPQVISVTSTRKKVKGDKKNAGQ